MRKPARLFRQRGGGRAFTVIELVIAIALAVGLGAVVVPMTVSRMREAAYREGVERVGTAVMLGRAEAQRRGVIIEVRAGVSGDGSGLISLSEVAGEAAGSEEAEGPNVGRVIGEPVELPSGVTVGRERDPAGLEAEEIVLTICLPDGRLIPSVESVVLAGAGGRRGRIGINAWTGVSRVDAVAAGPGSSDDAGTAPAPTDAEAGRP
ncbi:MAG: type II secretion system protein [Phycisphaeraceae bacterium]|nr:type II secretion system protein [Phycisphaeraceae bacterium]